MVGSLSDISLACQFNGYISVDNCKTQFWFYVNYLYANNANFAGFFNFLERLYRFLACEERPLGCL